MKLLFVEARLRSVQELAAAEKAGCTKLGLGNRYPARDAAEDLIHDCMGWWHDEEFAGHDRAIMLKLALTSPIRPGAVPWGWW